MADDSKGRIAIIGAGFIGRAWAIVFARAGYQARLYDAIEGAAAKALTAVDDSLADLKQAGLIADPVPIRERIVACKSIAEALEGAIHAQENVWEQRDLKAKIFAEMDAAAGPETVLASSSSAIPASEYTAELKGRDRCLVAHPGNPPYLLPVVELVPSPWTAPAAMDRSHRAVRIGGAGAGAAQPGDRRLRHEPAAGRRGLRGHEPGGPGHHLARRPGQGDAPQPGSALVLHGAVRDHGPECAQRFPGLPGPLPHPLSEDGRSARGRRRPGRRRPAMPCWRRGTRRRRAPTCRRAAAGATGA